MADDTTLAQIFEDSYATTANSVVINGYVPFTQNFGLNLWVSGTGFTAHAYYSETENTMVVAFAGTQAGFDYLTDGQLAFPTKTPWLKALPLLQLLYFKPKEASDLMLFTLVTRWVDTWLRWQVV